MQSTEYPKYMYHTTEEPTVVNNPDELKELGPDWAESPAAFGVETAPSAESIAAAKRKAAATKKTAKS